MRTRERAVISAGYNNNNIMLVNIQDHILNIEIGISNPLLVL